MSSGDSVARHGDRNSSHIQPVYVWFNGLFKSQHSDTVEPPNKGHYGVNGVCPW